MKNNIRKNRNIGTAKQGYGQNNKMVIPDLLFKNDIRSFYERLTDYTKIVKTINGHEFVFVIEKTLDDYMHACSVGDVAYMLQFIPKEDYGDMKYIIFRQPKRKESKLSTVWGRFVYSFQLEDEYYPAIILEAICMNDKLIWRNKLSVQDRKEFLRLQEDGFEFKRDKKFAYSDITQENTRNTQLYRTLFHEFGHYVHYWNIVEKPAVENEGIEEWEKRINFYHDSIPSSEKEIFAHTYAENLRKQLISDGIIPFDRINNNYDLATNAK